MSLHRPGLTLIEVMLAVLVLGLLTASIMGLQGVLVRSVFTAHGVIERIGFVRSFMVRADKEQLFVTEHKTDALEDPPTSLTYFKAKPVTATLASHEHIYAQHVHASWPGLLGEQHLQIVQLRFLPESKT